MTNLNKKMIGTVVKVEKMGSRYIATDSDNNDYTSYIHPPARSKAFKNGNALKPLKFLPPNRKFEDKG